MHPRGHALFLVMLLMAALAVTGAILGTRLATDLRASADDSRRAQLLWLARTASAQGKARTTTVVVGRERLSLQVAVRGGTVTATASGAAGRAVVTRGEERYQERFQRAR